MNLDPKERAAVAALLDAHMTPTSEILNALAAAQWEDAEEALRSYSQDRRLLHCLSDADNLDDLAWLIGHDEVREALSRLQAKASVSALIEQELGEQGPEEQASHEQLRETLAACETALPPLSSRYELRYVIYDTEAEEEVCGATYSPGFTQALAEIWNESGERG